MLVNGIPPIVDEDTAGVFKVDGDTLEVKNGLLKLKEVVSQSEASDDTIESIITGYYNGTYSLEDVKDIQAVGDIRTANDTDKAKFKIAAHSSFTNDYTVSIVEQSTCAQVILDFDHDTLVTSINNITKALITIQMYGTLGSSASVNVGCRMNIDGTNDGGQEESKRRTQCNGNFYNAVGFKTQIKQAIKQNCKNYYSSAITTTNDYCFLCSQYEVSGVRTHAPGIEGIQYSYYIISSNRIKQVGQEGKGVNATQQLRSPLSSDYNYAFCVIGVDGSVGSQTSTNSGSISVCTCL